MCARPLSHVLLSEIPWTVAWQAPLSMEFSRQEYWCGLPFPSPENLPNPDIKPALACGYFTTAATCEAPEVLIPEVLSHRYLRKHKGKSPKPE